MSVSKLQVAGSVIISTAVGAFVALTFAPKSGTETRRYMWRFGKRTVIQLGFFMGLLAERVCGPSSDSQETTAQTVEPEFDKVFLLATNTEGTKTALQTTIT